MLSGVVCPWRSGQMWSLCKGWKNIWINYYKNMDNLFTNIISKWELDHRSFLYSIFIIKKWKISTLYSNVDGVLILINKHLHWNCLMSFYITAHEEQCWADTEKYYILYHHYDFAEYITLRMQYKRDGSQFRCRFCLAPYTSIVSWGLVQRCFRGVAKSLFCGPCLC